MCGIFAEISFNKRKKDSDQNILHRISNRGPDQNQGISYENGCFSAYFFASVLWMQGSQLTGQPVDSSEGTLLYNGDIFDNNVPENESDTLFINKSFLSEHAENSTRHCIETIKSIKGPYALIYFCKKTSEIFFTRDKIGRTSLLFYYDSDRIIISSILGRDYKCLEVPATNIYSLNIINKKIKSYSWFTEEYTECSLDEWMKHILDLQSTPDEMHQLNLDLPTEINEDDGVIKFIKEIINKNRSHLEIMKELMKNTVIETTVQKLIQLLNKSVRIRLKTQPNRCKKCVKNMDLSSCDHCTVGILFSGGLDCTILAFLADKYLPESQPIDLINVAFKKSEELNYNVPDRITGINSYEELKKLCPSRNWVFKEINVPLEELRICQRTDIADLVQPRQTILDESLGSALWFAARGGKEDSSLCRVLLLGSGADELFGGYTRHRNAFRRLGWSGLQKELMLDWSRISFRNLARDNRVICDHGRQPRMPYLDEDFTQFVLQLKPWLKCYPSNELGPGIGDKLMLRLVAFELGIKSVALYPKRALQFGSRIANKKEKGSEISMNFLNCSKDEKLKKCV